MTLLERVKHLCKEKGVTQGKMEKDIGISNGASSKWKTSSPSMAILQKLADYFSVPIEYLTKGEKSENSSLSERDRKDIARDLNNIMEKLSSGEDGPASYDCEPLSPESAELFREELEIALKRLKIINKEKYNPYKNKTDKNPDRA